MKKWFIYSKKADFKGLAERFGIDQVTARILRNRDIISEKDIDLFLNGSLQDLYDYHLLPDADKAAGLVAGAINEKLPVRIVGDYDIDGVCSTYILLKGLKMLGAFVDSRIPDRIRDGYGINEKIVDEAICDKVGLLLTCDNGIAAIEELNKAKAAGITVVVTDHHNVRSDENGNEVLPAVDAVVDVKRRGNQYPTEEICGAVTAWKLLMLVYEKMGRAPEECLQFLEFAAIATVGDIMSLTGENRIIVKEGLKILNGGRHPADKNTYGTLCPGLKMLIKCLNLDGHKLDEYHIGFVIGPCINAGGRLENAGIVLKLFLSEDDREAEMLAEHLIGLNDSRKSMTEKGVKDSLEIIEEGKCGDKVLVVYLPELHESLAGIVAGRVKELFSKPAIVITRGKEGLKGSGRSIENYDMFSALCDAKEFLTKFGGHKLAAGLSLEEKNLDGFRKRLNENAALDESDFVEKVWIDAAMPFDYVNFGLVEELEMLAPFGQGFEKPLFARKNIKASSFKVLGKQKNVLRMRLTDEKGYSADGIMFGDAEELLAQMNAAGNLSILYYPKINEFNGRRSIQMEIRDFIAG